MVFQLCRFHYPELSDWFGNEKPNRYERRMLAKLSKTAKRHAVKEAERESVRKTRRHHIAENRKNGESAIVFFYVLSVGSLIALYLLG